MDKQYLTDGCFDELSKEHIMEIVNARDSILKLMKGKHIFDVFAALYEVQTKMIYRHEMSDGAPELIRFLHGSCNSLKELIKERAMTN